MRQAEPNGNTRKKATGSDHVPGHNFANTGLTNQAARSSKPGLAKTRYAAHGGKTVTCQCGADHSSH